LLTRREFKTRAVELLKKRETLGAAAGASAGAWIGSSVGVAALGGAVAGTVPLAVLGGGFVLAAMKLKDYKARAEAAERALDDDVNATANRDDA